MIKNAKNHIKTGAEFAKKIKTNFAFPEKSGKKHVVLI